MSLKLPVLIINVLIAFLLGIISPVVALTDGGTVTDITTTSVQVDILVNNKKISAENGLSLLGTDTLTLSGLSEPYSIITLTIYSNPITFNAQADSTGYWKIETGISTIAAGNHSLVIKAQSPSTQEEKIIKQMSFKVVSLDSGLPQTGDNKTSTAVNTTKSAADTSNTQLTTYIAVGIGVTVIIGVVFLVLSKKKKELL